MVDLETPELEVRTAATAAAFLPSVEHMLVLAIAFGRVDVRALG